MYFTRIAWRKTYEEQKTIAMKRTHENIKDNLTQVQI